MTNREQEYKDLMVEINECLNTLLYQTETRETPCIVKVTETARRSTPPRVTAPLLGVSGNFSRRLYVVKIPHCGGCKKAISDSEQPNEHRGCITNLFKRNSLAWKKAIYLARPVLSV